ncbi:glutathione S-transferase N-terminal domain-containing protein [Acinetobacter boissieri]|uniref:Glutathione S-transferase n=1 Tax=Acinetobacter boissieri TaxID=1219383 RepID=A0A1G6GZT7_9GAMM|nr:glutathione S-transferase N-terminal domain-containing protein [Acinetobacter boissieri]SDB87461.1 glutathione S-transferase [Acinetobacter boissieri]
MRTLYQFPLSHFCEKARWVLDHKELDYVAHNLTPGIHRFFTQRKASVNTLPLLNDCGHWIADSTKITIHLDQCYPENNLVHHNPTINRHILEMNDLANELGNYVRRWVLGGIILPNSHSIDILIGEKGYLKKFKKYSKPMLSLVLRKHFQLNTHDLNEIEAHILNIINIFNQQLLKTNTGYMVQDYLTLADIAICSMVAPILNVEGTPWEVEQLQSNEESNILKNKILTLPLGEYVNHIYKNQRNARVDWRGI